MALLAVKLLVVGGLVVWFYSRSEARLSGDEGEVESAAGTMAVGGPGGAPVMLEMDREHATELYNLVREGSWASAAGEAPRATVDIRYSTGAADRLEFRGRDMVSVNGTHRRVNGAMRERHTALSYRVVAR